MLEYKLLDDIDTTNIDINNECVICLENMDNKKAILNCNHAFHKQCVLEWMKLQQKCPICRNNTKYILNLNPEKNEKLIIEIKQQENTENTENIIIDDSDNESDYEVDQQAIISIRVLHPIAKVLASASALAIFFFTIFQIR
jgi:hypothetical protein